MNYADFNQLLYAAGFLFMGATEEQMNLVASSSMDHVSYILILYSIACMVFLFTNLLVSLYDRLANIGPDNKTVGNGYTTANRRPMGEGRMRDVEEFELEGLVSDEESEEAQNMFERSENGPSNIAQRS